MIATRILKIDSDVVEIMGRSKLAPVIAPKLIDSVMGQAWTSIISAISE